MEFVEFETLNGPPSKSAFSSSSSTSSSTSSSNSSSNHPANISTPIASNALLHHANQSYSSNGEAPGMSSSTSQIFATAAAFNISQNDTVFYSRETIHLLAKFLSNHSDNVIFRSLYAFAPDNLAWLWAFFDWDSQIDLDKIETQDVYHPFKLNEDVSLDDEHVKLINKLLADAPLIQYKYRDNIMIADVYKFIEHVQKIQAIPVARALFLLYFPRFSMHIENPLKKYLSPKILKTNLSRVKYVDDIIRSLIKSRYSNLDEYKEKILTGAKLPSYVKSLLSENSFWTSAFLANQKQQQQQQQQQMQQIMQLQQQIDMLNDFNSSNKSSSASSPTSSVVNAKAEAMSRQAMAADLLNNRSNSSIAKSNNENVMSDENKYNSLFQTLTSIKTSDYLKFLQKSTKINNDLDHISFDTKNTSMNKELEEIDELAYEDNNTSNLMLIANSSMNKKSLVNEMKSNKINATSIGSDNIPSIDGSANEEEAEEEEKDEFDSGLEGHGFGSADTKPFIPANSLEAVDSSLLSKSRLNNLSPTSNFLNMNQSLAELQLQTAFLNYNAYPSPHYEPHSDLQQTDYSSNANKFSSNLGLQQSLMSPSMSMSRHTNRAMMNTPKTPTNLNQYVYQSSSCEPKQNDSFWPSSSNNLPRLNLHGNSLSNNYAKNFLGSSMTPPPSATFKTPLSVLTSADLSQEEAASYMLNSPAMQNHIKNQFEPLAVNSSFQDESLSRYLKHSAFISSPVARLNSNKLNDYSSFVGSNNSANSGNNSLNGSRLNLVKNTPDFLTFSTFNNLKSPKQISATNAHAGFFNENMQKSPNSTVTYGNTNYYNKSHQNSMHYTWAGRLPPKIYSENSLYSRKVFLGGLPWDVNQAYLLQLLNKYGPVKLEIPGKDAKHPRVSTMCKTQERSTPGYVYIIYDHESSVQRMLADCRKEYKNGGEHYFYTIFIQAQNAANGNPMGNFQNSFNNHNKRGKAKEVEVIPWNQEDTSYVPQNKTTMLPAKIDAKSTIFVGALHGMLNAQGLAKVMNEIFGEVIHAGLDTDKYKYPIGSGRVTFRNRQSYIKAIKAKFVTIKANLEVNDPSPKFEKTIQIDPYLEDAKCCKCEGKSNYFCRNENCLDYYCMHCWEYKHETKGNGDHLPLSRQNKPNHG